MNIDTPIVEKFGLHRIFEFKLAFYASEKGKYSYYCKRCFTTPVPKNQISLKTTITAIYGIVE